MEVQGNGVPQARHQHAELSLVEIDAADLVAVGEDDKGLERIWRRDVGVRGGGGGGVGSHRQLETKHSAISSEVALILDNLNSV